MISIQQASKSFKEITAVDKLSLEVQKGEILGLLGANGAGKSTTIHMLLGFLRPDSGVVRINEMDVSKEANAVRKLIGYIPENVNLYTYLSGIENLDYFCRLAALKYNKSDLQEILLTCGLEERAHQERVETYSKGMRQKVGIAIAYAKKAKVYLSNEGSKNYIHEGFFEKENIQVIYNEFTHPEYQQFNAKSFLPNLSIIDLLFNIRDQTDW